MVRMIMELVQNRSFTLTTGDIKQSKIRRLKNGVPQKSILVPLLFNIYTIFLPLLFIHSFISFLFSIISKQFNTKSYKYWKDQEKEEAGQRQTLKHA